jgi:NADPH-dependent curcumin reductase CurA
METAKSVVLVQPFDSGLPTPENFVIVESNVPPCEEEGSIKVKLFALSADPYLRGRMKTTSIFKAGSPISGFVVGKVIESRNEKWREGSLFGASLPFTTIQTLSSKDIASTIMWDLTNLVSESELSLGLGVLGMPGSTAYGGLIDILRPNQGETIFISAASGAVGSLVGQLAKQMFNCTVIGSCGGPEKCALIKEKFGFDYAIDYKTIPDAEALKAALKEVAPNGIDMYFENVSYMYYL